VKPSRVDRRVIQAWCLYDWANSAFATTVLAALFPPFFRSLAIGAGMAGNAATAAWAFVTAGALLAAALVAPLLGAMADATGGVKRYLAVFAGLGIAATFAFTLIPDGGWQAAAALFIAADLGFAGSIVFYESLLPHIAGPGDIDRISARGYAWGYAGGGLLLALEAWWIAQPSFFGMPGTDFAVRASFAATALWWAVFSIPLLIRVPEPGAATGLPGAGPAQATDSGPRPTTLGGRVVGRADFDVAMGWRRLRKTLREVHRYRQLFAFLVAYWVYSDAIGTIIKMAVAYGDEIGISLNDLVRALLLTQAVGIPASLAFGRLAARRGARPALLLGLFVYGLICAGGYFMSTATHFYLLAGSIGLVQGGCQALSRSLFASLVPRHKSAEFFGFFSTSSRFAGIIGPLVFGLVGGLTGTSRLSILTLIAFFLAGGLLLLRVDLDEGRRVAREAEKEAA